MGWDGTNFLRIFCLLSQKLFSNATVLGLCQKVDYPLVLDVYDLCSDDLKKKLEAPRQVSTLF